MYPDVTRSDWVGHIYFFNWGLFGSFYIGHLADKYGRRKSSLLHCFLYIIGSTINGLSNNYGTLLLGRFISGLGAGSALVITSIYINEVSPVETKGLLGSMNQFSINIGILLTQLLSLKWSNNNDWRWLLFMASFIAVINLIVVLIHLHESPVWLANQGNSTQAFTVLHRLRGGSYSVATDEVNSWKSNGSFANGTPESETLLEEGNSDGIATGAGVSPAGSTNSKQRVTVKDYVTQPEYRNSLIAATGILVLQQFDGINSIIFYGVSVLVSIFLTIPLLLIV